MPSLKNIKEKVECFWGERYPIPKQSGRIFHYYLSIDTQKYAVYERSRGADRVVAAHDKMVLVQKNSNKNQLILYPYYQNRFIFHKIYLSEKQFPNLIKGSNVLLCLFLPYMRQVRSGQYIKSVRLVVITDKAQIYHNCPARNKKFDGFSLAGDNLLFEESVIWDLPGRKYPVQNPTESDLERFYPNLPTECYRYHPMLNTDNEFQDRYGNGGFGKNTIVFENGRAVRVPRFYIHDRSVESNPFHFIGSGEKDHKMSLLATYRSNVTAGVRTCIFATSDGGRTWYCKYEFADLGEYEFRQGHAESFGKNVGNPIQNAGYDKNYKGELQLLKRKLIVPSESCKEPTVRIMWDDIGPIESIGTEAQLTLKTEHPHGLTTGNIVALSSNVSEDFSMKWMVNPTVGNNSAGNGLLFKIQVVDDYRISLFELVSSPDNNISCRHVHHINRIKDGWLIGTGEIYPNGWLLYFQMKEADTFSIRNANEEFRIIRLNSTEMSAQRTMGAFLTDSKRPELVYASDHDCLKREKVAICDQRSEKFDRNSTGVFKGYLSDIDNRQQHTVIFEASEPCFYFQELDSMLVFCGQRGQLGLSFDKGISWSKERIRNPVIHYYGANGQRYYFDDCVIFRK